MTQDPMSSNSEPDALGQTAPLSTKRLIHMLVENRGATNARAVDVVHTAAVVKVEVTEPAGESTSRVLESVALLSPIGDSLQAAPIGQV